MFMTRPLRVCGIRHPQTMQTQHAETVMAGGVWTGDLVRGILLNIDLLMFLSEKIPETSVKV